MNKSELVAIRSIKPDDKNFIYASWLRGLYYGDSWFSLTPKSQFMKHYHRLIDFILAKPSTQIQIACLREDEDVILGYSVFDGDKVHWAFVKKNWRGIGLARDLLPKTLKVSTHLTKVGLSIMKKHNIEFNPFEV